MKRIILECPDEIDDDLAKKNLQSCFRVYLDDKSKGLSKLGNKLSLDISVVFVDLEKPILLTFKDSPENKLILEKIKNLDNNISKEGINLFSSFVANCIEKCADIYPDFKYKIGEEVNIKLKWNKNEKIAAN